MLPRGGIAIASEMKALFAHPGIDPLVDEDAIAFYAESNPLVIGTRTLFTNVSRLPQATAMLIDAAGKISRSWRYWTPDFDAIRPYREGAAIEEFAELLRESVRLRLRSDVPLGACLSGGLDSSVLVGLTARLNGDGCYRGKTYSARFDDDPTISEGEYVDLVNDYVGAQPRAVCPDPGRLIEESRTLHWHHEEPLFSASMYLEWCVMRLARTNDDIVILNGQGADELLAGYLPYFLRLQYDWLRQGRPLRLAVETLLSAFRLYREGQLYRDSKRRFDGRLRQNMAILQDWWLSGHNPNEAIPPEEGLPPQRGSSVFRYLLAHGLLYSALPVQLHSADRNGMAFGIEARFPFLDYRLVDWCIGLPDRALIKHGWHKYILRRAARGIVPRQIRWRVDKVGFAAPFDRWLRGALKEWAHDRIFGGPATRLSFYNRRTLERAWNEHQAGSSDHSSTLWPWISISEWLALATEGLWKTGLSAAGCQARYPALT
jgi:asparagine synthase (glutamine-hydrolysing)